MSHTDLARDAVQLQHRIGLAEEIGVLHTQIATVARFLKDGEKEADVLPVFRRRLQERLALLRHNLQLARIRFDADDLMN